jgi:hypothetical protein
LVRGLGASLHAPFFVVEKYLPSLTPPSLRPRPFPGAMAHSPLTAQVEDTLCATARMGATPLSRECTIRELLVEACVLFMALVNLDLSHRAVYGGELRYSSPVAFALTAALLTRRVLAAFGRRATGPLSPVRPLPPHPLHSSLRGDARHALGTQTMHRPNPIVSASAKPSPRRTSRSLIFASRPTSRPDSHQRCPRSSQSPCTTPNFYNCALPMRIVRLRTFVFASLRVFSRSASSAGLHHGVQMVRPPTEFHHRVTADGGDTARDAERRPRRADGSRGPTGPLPVRRAAALRATVDHLRSGTAPRPMPATLLSPAAENAAISSGRRNRTTAVGE